jgi:hypothetical protein
MVGIKAKQIVLPSGYDGYHNSDYCYEIVPIDFQYVSASFFVNEEDITAV